MTAHRTVTSTNFPVHLPTSTDDLTPSQTGERLLQWSIAKSQLTELKVWILGINAGVFIALGAAFFTLAVTDVTLTHGPSRVLGGMCFSIGLLFVTATGAELSTGNCMAFSALLNRNLSGRVITQLLMRSFVANALGALLVAALFVMSGLIDGATGKVAARIAETKLSTPLPQVFVRGILCNALVCLAVWLMLSARTLIGRLIGLIFPITAFVALGLEHSIANLYLLPIGLFAGAAGNGTMAFLNILVVTAGNLVGGIAVALSLWACYIYQPSPQRG